MYDTYKLLEPLVYKTLLDETLEVIAEKYETMPDSRLLATAYAKVYKLAIVINNGFWGLTEADMASFCLEKLDFCLRTYIKDKGVKFITYFSRVYKNKLREETENLNRKKRKCILESINDLINVGVEDTYNLIEMLLPDTLTQKEYQLCLLESEGYDRAYCAEKLNVSRMTISNMEKSLRVKLNGLQNC